MKKISPAIASCLLLIFASLPAVAEVKISAKCRITNRPPGRCGWCALETLGRHHHIQALYGLTEENARRATVPDLEQVLEEKGVGYRIQHQGSYDTQILRDAIRRDCGAAVGFRELYPGKGGHIVTVIDFGPTEVCVIDPNDADGRTRTMSRERFLYWWDGLALVLDPDRKDTKGELKVDSSKPKPGHTQQFGLPK